MTLNPDHVKCEFLGRLPSALPHPLVLDVDVEQLPEPFLHDNMNKYRARFIIGVDEVVTKGREEEAAKVFAKFAKFHLYGEIKRLAADAMHQAKMRSTIQNDPLLETLQKIFELSE